MIALLKRLAPQITRRPKPAHPLACANAIVEELRADSQVPTLPRLSRLIVLCDCWSLALLERPIHSGITTLFLGSPSVPSIHSAFRSYGTDEIMGLARHPQIPAFEYPPLAPGPERDIVREVVCAYRNISAYNLSELLRDRIPDLRDGEIIPHSALIQLTKPRS